MKVIYSFALLFIIFIFASCDKDYLAEIDVAETVYVGSYDKRLYAIDATTGLKKWESMTKSPIHSSPTVASGGVYVSSLNEKSLYAFDATTGAVRWVFQTGGNISSSPCVVMKSGEAHHSGGIGVQE